MSRLAGVERGGWWSAECRSVVVDVRSARAGGKATSGWMVDGARRRLWGGRNKGWNETTL